MNLSKEDLLAISSLFDKRFDRIDRQFEKIDMQFAAVSTRLDKVDSRMDGLEARMGGLEARMSGLETWQRRFALVQENEVLPQLRSIQECYVSTYWRYKDYSDRMEASFEDLTLVKEVVTEHSEKFNRILA
jgi:DNA repair ATPase RecN